MHPVMSENQFHCTRLDWHWDKRTHIRPVPKGGSGGSGEPSRAATRSAQANEILFFFNFCALFVSGPCCNHSVFTARVHKIAGFGSIFPKISRGSMPPDPPPPRRAWASPKHILVRLKTKRTHPPGLLRTAMHMHLPIL